VTDAASTSSGVVEISGASLYYEVAGHGHPLVLLHEGFADSGMFDDQVADFAARYRIIRYDRHGCGRSDTPAGPFADHDALRDLLRHLGFERAAILGMSAGGGVAIDFALAHPSMVDTLVLAVASIGCYELSAPTLRGWTEISSALERGDVPGTVELTLRMWIDGPKRAAGDVDPGVRERMRAMMTRFYSRPMAQSQPLAPAARTRLAEIRVPTLVVVADADVPDILAQADLLHRSVAGAQKVVIPDVAHAPNMERPAPFNQLVLQFLDAHVGDGPID